LKSKLAQMVLNETHCTSEPPPSHNTCGSLTLATRAMLITCRALLGLSV